MGDCIENLKWIGTNATSCANTGTDYIYSINNEIYFNSDINELAINKLIKELNNVKNSIIDKNKQLLHSSNESNKIQIILYIDSPGGFLKDCFKFMDFIRIFKKNFNVHLTTIAMGMIASAATIIALSGDTKYITENCTCMIHELYAGQSGKYTQLLSKMKHIGMYHTKIVKLYLDNNKKIGEEKLLDLLKTETWFTAEEYIEHGFADKLY